MRIGQRGFTLIELMVTLIVVAILISLAAPNFTTQILNNRSVAFSEGLIAELNSARYEAINRTANVSICASSDGASCTGNWTDGYIMFLDTAATSNAVTPVVGAILHKSEKMDSKTVLDVTNSGAAVGFIRFTSLGTLGRINNSNNAIVLDTQMTGCKGNNRRVITLGLSGMVSVESQACQ